MHLVGSGVRFSSSSGVGVGTAVGPTSSELATCAAVRVAVRSARARARQASRASEYEAAARGAPVSATSKVSVLIAAGAQKRKSSQNLPVAQARYPACP